MKGVALGFLILAAALCIGCREAPVRIDSPKIQRAPVDALWPHTASDLDPDPAVVFGQLPNRFRYIIMENREPAGRVSMHLNVQAGSLQELDGEEGTAHFLEHMVFNGSTNFQPGELVKYFQRIGMQFGPDANAHTGFHETVYDILLADNTEQSITEGLTVLSDYAQGALLLETEVDRERPVILAEKRTRDSVNYRTWVDTVKFEMPDTLIPSRMPIGTLPAIENANRSSLRGFYDAWYRPENMMVVIVGDIQAASVAKMIAKTFTPMRARGAVRQPLPFGSIAHHGNKSFYHFEKEAGKANISIETLRRSAPFTDNRAYRRKRIAEELGSRILENRLAARIGKRGTPYTKSATGSGIYLNKVRYAEISAESSPDNWAPALTALETFLRQALLFGFTEPELDRVKKDYRAELEHAVKNASTRRSPDLARRIIRKTNLNRVFLSPLQEKELKAALLDATDLSQVNAAFRNSWSEDHRLILVTGNADLTEADKAPEQLILDVYNRSRTRDVAQPQLEAQASFPYFEVPERGAPVTRVTPVADLGISQLDLANGVLVNLKQTDFEADQIAVKVGFGHGRSAEPGDKPGLGPFTELVVNESALGGLDKDGLDRALAGKNLQVDFKVTEDKFYFIGRCVKGEIETLLQLLYAHLTDPGFRPDAFFYSQERYDQRYQALEKSINGALTLSGLHFLAGGDSRFGLPARQHIASLTLEDVVRWIGPAIRQAPLEVSVVGDFDPPATRALIARYFGSLPDRKPFAVAARGNRPVFPAGKTLTVGITTRLPKGLTVVAYPTADMWDIKRTRRLMILAEVISERLRIGIREKLGAAYSTAAFNRPARAYEGYGVLMIYIQVAPEKVAAIRDAVRQIVRTLVSEGITEDELKRAIDPTLSGIRDARRRNGYWLNTVLAGSRAHPVQLAWSRDILSDFTGITVPEIEALAREYLVDERAAEILVTSRKRDAADGRANQ